MSTQQRTLASYWLVSINISMYLIILSILGGDLLNTTRDSKTLTIGEYFHSAGGLKLKTEYEDLILPAQKTTENSECAQHCVCQNMKLIPADSNLQWRFDTWVTIMATLSSLGFITSVGLAIFLAFKICNEVLEVE